MKVITMRQRLIVALLLSIVIFSGILPVAAQNPEPTEVPPYDPTCPINMMEAYMSGWERNHRGSEGVIDVVTAAQVARGVYKAFEAIKPDCRNTIGGFKQTLLRSMHGDYPPEDLARLMSYIQEAVGDIPVYNDCSFMIASQYLRRVDWGDMPAVQIGKTIGEIFRTVREVVPNGECNGTFQIIQEIMSHIDDIPADASLITTLYKIVGDATEGHYLSNSSCNYTLAKTFFEKVQWDNLKAADILQLVSDTFKITYKISGDTSCDYDPALAITAMLLNDMYRFPPDASIIQRTYDAATGELVVTSTPTPTP
ncbi:MAG: hypothetical protein GC179_11755 [Anaerolineaceae bacterium]|nr:hypothetical protein [Anaerolineaceae bacterium]